MTSQLARGYEIRGTVRNLADGRVHLRAQGTPEEIDAFFAAIREEMAALIRSDEVAMVEAPAEQLVGFRIVQ